MDQTKTIAIYGQSGHGQVIADIATALGYTSIIWIDDNPNDDAITFMTYYEFHYTIPIALGIGDNKTRQKIYHLLKEKHLTIATLIHPSAVISPSVVIEEGSVIMPLAVINANTSIAKGVIINSASVIEHDCKISDFVHISPKVALAGNVTVGTLTHLGIGTNVIQGVKVGNSVTLGAGSCVIKDLDDNVTAYGVPAKVRRS